MEREREIEEEKERESERKDESLKKRRKRIIIVYKLLENRFHVSLGVQLILQSYIQQIDNLIKKICCD